jgi:cytoskeleton protein RodZ
MSDEITAAGQANGNDNAPSGIGTGTVAKDGAELARAAQAPVPVRLRAAREALGLSLREVAARTRITFRYVEAIEAGDYASLPGRPYALGFARGYARVVGLDEAEIAEGVRRELGTGAPRVESRVFQQFEVGDPAKTPSRLVSWLALVLVIGVVGLGMVMWKSYYWPSAELPALVGSESEAPAATSSALPAPRAAPAAAPSGPVVFTALESGVWVKFYDGAGTQLLQKQLAQGESYTVPSEAQSPKLWTGRPDALAITIGGQAIARLAEERKIMKDVAIDADSLRARSTPMGSGPVVTATSAPAAQTNRPVTMRSTRPRARTAAPSSASGEAQLPVATEPSSTTAN